MKSVQLLLKSLILALLLSQSNAHAWQWDDVGNGIYNFCTDKTTLIVASIGALLIGSVAWIAAEAKKGSNAIPRQQHAILADTCSISNALWSIESALTQDPQFASQDRAVRVQKNSGWKPADKDATEFAKKAQKLFLETYYDKTVLHYLGNDFQNTLQGVATEPAPKKRTLMQDKGEHQSQRIDAEMKAFYFNAHRTVQTEWMQPCSTGKLKKGDQKYKTVIIDRNCQSFNSSCHADPIVHIKMANDDILCITKAGNFKPHNDLELLVYIKEIGSKMMNPGIKASVTIPIATFKQIKALDWLRGITFGEYYLVKANQDLSFTINEKAQTRRGLHAPQERDNDTTERKSVFINDEFIVWIMRKGVQNPIFAAFVPTQCWQKIA